MKRMIRLGVLAAIACALNSCGVADLLGRTVSNTVQSASGLVGAASAL